MLSWILALLGCEKKQEAAPELPEIDPNNDIGLFYPVLRNYEPGGLFEEIAVHRRISDELGVWACRRIPRPDGGNGIDYVMKANLEVYGMSEEEILAACYENFLESEIRVNVLEQDTSKLFQLNNSHGLVAAILGHENIYADWAAMTSSTEMAVLIMSQEAVCVTSAKSSFEPGLSQIAEECAKEGDVIALTPRVYYWTANGKLISQEEWEKLSKSGEP